MSSHPSDFPDVNFALEGWQPPAGFGNWPLLRDGRCDRSARRARGGVTGRFSAPTGSAAHPSPCAMRKSAGDETAGG